MFLSWMVFCFGIWMIVTAALARFSPWHTIVDFVVGIVLVVISFSHRMRERKG